MLNSHFHLYQCNDTDVFQSNMSFVISAIRIFQLTWLLKRESCIRKIVIDILLFDFKNSISNNAKIYFCQTRCSSITISMFWQIAEVCTMVRRNTSWSYFKPFRLPNILLVQKFWICHDRNIDGLFLFRRL